VVTRAAHDEFFSGRGAANDTVRDGEPTALRELRSKNFIEDRLKDTDGNSDNSVCKCTVKV
jgi:hypothetical protein